MSTARGGFTVGRLMLGVAVSAVLLASAIYRWENLDIDRASTSADLRTMARGDVAARLRAAESLGRSNLAEGHRILESLQAATVGDPAPEVRRASVRSMGLFLSALATVRRNQQPPVAEITEAEVVAIRVVIRAMGDDSTEVRREAVQAFGRLPSHSTIEPGLFLGAVPGLVRLLGDPDPTTRFGAVHSLTWIEPPTVEARARMIALMQRDLDPNVRCKAIEALVRVWPSSDLYSILLARRDQVLTPAEEQTILGNLGNLPAPPLEVVPGLIALMQSDEMAALAVPDALVLLGNRAIPWLGPLQKVAERELVAPPTPFRLAYGAPLKAAYALAAIDPDSPEAQAMLGPLTERLRDTRDQAEAWKAAGVLEKYRGSAASAIPTIREMLKSPAATTRTIAAGLLGKLGPEAVAALGDLDVMSRADPDPSVRHFAQRSFQILRPR